MFLSICIPCYNRAYIVSRALDSLVNQTCRDFETILVDDGSSDDLAEIVEKYIESANLRYIRKENGGKHTALNKGIEAAKGEYFCILDSDDFFDVNFVKRVREIIKNNSWNTTLCGVMGRCENVADGCVIGDVFERETISYIDFHFRDSKHYGDCCECVKTSILKNYRWPEQKNTKFVPEAYVFDKIGVEYSLYCTNEVFKYVEYMADGITRNVSEHQKKNVVGYLYNYVSKLEDVFPKCKNIPLKRKVAMWRLYWKAVRIDQRNLGPRVKRVTLLGAIIRVISLMI